MRVKLADMGTAKPLTLLGAPTQFTQAGAGTLGWMAPERMGELPSVLPLDDDSEEDESEAVALPALPGATHVQAGRSADVFSLGCLFYYVLAARYSDNGRLRSGNHPFGRPAVRVANIQLGRAHVSIDLVGCDAAHLIRHMVEYDRVDRFSMLTVVEHPYFRTPRQLLEAVQQVSDKLEGFSNKKKGELQRLEKQKAGVSAQRRAELTARRDAIFRAFHTLEDVFEQHRVPQRPASDAPGAGPWWPVARSREWQRHFFDDPADFDVYHMVYVAELKVATQASQRAKSAASKAAKGTAARPLAATDDGATKAKAKTNAKAKADLNDEATAKDESKASTATDDRDNFQKSAGAYLLGIPPASNTIPGSPSQPAGAYDLLRTVRNHLHHYHTSDVVLLARAYRRIMDAWETPPADAAQAEALVRERLQPSREGDYFGDLYLPYILARFPELNVCIWEFGRATRYVKGHGQSPSLQFNC